MDGKSCSAVEVVMVREVVKVVIVFVMPNIEFYNQISGRPNYVKYVEEEILDMSYQYDY